VLGIALSSTHLQAQSSTCQNSATLTSDVPPKTHIVVVSVDFRGDDALPEALRDQLADKVRQAKLAVSLQDSDEAWVNELELAVDESLRGQGYAKAHTVISPYLLKAESRERLYAVSLAIALGRLYRMGSLQVVNSTVFSPIELRDQIALRPGEIFDVFAIQRGLDAIGRAYAAKGYIDATVEPETSFDDDTGLIGLVLKLDEGKQYHVRRVEILGLVADAETALRCGLAPGEVFDWRAIEDFMKTQKSLLPTNAAEKNISVRRDPKDSTVDLVLDFRRCS
jgi:outer membrane protein assembly factor BamA